MTTKSSNIAHLVLDVNVWLDFMVVNFEQGNTNFVSRDLKSANYASRILSNFLKNKSNNNVFTLNSSEHIIKAMRIVLKDTYLWEDDTIANADILLRTICANSNGDSNLDFRQALSYVEVAVPIRSLKTKSSSIEVIDYEDLCVIATAADAAREGYNCILVTNDTGLLNVSHLTLPKLGVAIVSSRNICQFLNS